MRGKIFFNVTTFAQVSVIMSQSISFFNIVREPQLAYFRLKSKPLGADPPRRRNKHLSFRDNRAGSWPYSAHLPAIRLAIIPPCLVPP